MRVVGFLVQAFSPSKQQTFYQLNHLLSPITSFSKTRCIHDEDANQVEGEKQHQLATQGPDVLMLLQKPKKKCPKFFIVFEIYIYLSTDSAVKAIFLKQVNKSLNCCAL